MGGLPPLLRSAHLGGAAGHAIALVFGAAVRLRLAVHRTQLARAAGRAGASPGALVGLPLVRALLAAVPTRHVGEAGLSAAAVPAFSARAAGARATGRQEHRRRCSNRKKDALTFHGHLPPEHSQSLEAAAKNASTVQTAWRFARRSVSTVNSGGAPTRGTGPFSPSPRFTYN